MNKNVLALVALLVIVVAAGLAWRRMHHKPAPDFTVDEEVGQVVAEETARLVRNPGELVIITQDTTVALNEALDTQVRSFQQALAKHASLKSPKVEKIPQPAWNEGLTKAELQQIMGAHPQAAAIVSFMGFPIMAPSELSAGGTRPILAAVFNSPSPQEPNDLRSQRSLNFAIVARTEPAAEVAAEAKKPRAQFEANYVLSKSE